MDIEDFDAIEELEDSCAEEDIITADLVRDRDGIKKELTQLQEYAELAQSITENSKGENLLTALHKGFEETEKLGGQRKAVIFTESRRTQDYLYNLLSNNGYAGHIVFLNGTNNDFNSKRILEEWKERQKNAVVVINFLNRKNAADVRVYQLLDQKFRLFSGVFGSSDHS